MATQTAVFNVHLQMQSKGFVKGADDAKLGTDGLDTSTRKATRSTKNFTAGLGGLKSVLATLGIAAAGRQITQLATAYDAAFTKIETLVGVNRATLDGWRKDLLALGPELGRGPQELADALFVVTSAGARGAEALEIVETAGKAAAIGLGETADIARVVTAAIQTYGSASLNASQATNILLGTVREGNLEASGLASSLGRVLGIAQSVGVEFGEVGAFVATLSRTGLTAAESVTALSGTLASLVKGSSDASKALASVGMTTEGLLESLAGDGLNAALIDLVEAFDGDIRALQRVIPEKEALVGVLGVAGAQSAELARITRDLTGELSILGDEFLRVQESPKQIFARLLATLQSVGIELGSKVLPGITKLAQSLVDLGKDGTGLAVVGDRITDVFNGTAEAVSFLIKNLRAAAVAVGTFFAVMAAGKLTSLLIGIQSLNQAFLAVALVMDVVRAKAITMWAAVSLPAAVAVGIGALAFHFVKASEAIAETEKAARSLDDTATTMISNIAAALDSMRSGEGLVTEETLAALEAQGERIQTEIQQGLTQLEGLRSRIEESNTLNIRSGGTFTSTRSHERLLEVLASTERSLDTLEVAWRKNEVAIFEVSETLEEGTALAERHRKVVAELVDLYAEQAAVVEKATGKLRGMLGLELARWSAEAAGKLDLFEIAVKAGFRSLQQMNPEARAFAEALLTIRKNADGLDTAIEAALDVSAEGFGSHVGPFEAQIPVVEDLEIAIDGATDGVEELRKAQEESRLAWLRMGDAAADALFLIDRDIGNALGGMIEMIRAGDQLSKTFADLGEGDGKLAQFFGGKGGQVLAQIGQAIAGYQAAASVVGESGKDLNGRNNDEREIGTKIGATAGAIVGSIIGPLGTALGAMIGGLLGGALGSLFGHGTENSRGTLQFGEDGLAFGFDRDDGQGTHDAVQAIVDSVATAFEALEALTGGTLAGSHGVGIKVNSKGQIEVDIFGDNPISLITDDAQEAFDAIMVGMIRNSRFEGMSEAMTELLKVTTATTFDELLAQVGTVMRADELTEQIEQLLPGFDSIIDTLDGFREQISSLEEELLATGLSAATVAEIIAVTMEKLEQATIAASNRIEADLIGSILQYIEDEALRIRLIEIKGQLELANMRAQVILLEALGVLTAAQIALINGAIDQVEAAINGVAAAAGAAATVSVPRVYIPRSSRVGSSSGTSNLRTGLAGFLEGLQSGSAFSGSLPSGVRLNNAIQAFNDIIKSGEIGEDTLPRSRELLEAAKAFTGGSGPLFRRLISDLESGVSGVLNDRHQGVRDAESRSRAIGGSTNTEKQVQEEIRDAAVRTNDILIDSARVQVEAINGLTMAQEEQAEKVEKAIRNSQFAIEQASRFKPSSLD